MPFVGIAGFFCEDIREETGNKDTLVGVFPDNVFIPHVPALVPKICIYVRIHIGADWEPTPIQFSIRPPDGTAHLLGLFQLDDLKSEIAAAKERGRPYIGLIFKAVAAPFPIVEGRTEITAAIDGKDWFCCGINALLGEPKLDAASPTRVSTAFVPLASQSPNAP